MWGIRFLNGSMAGKIIPLKEGPNVLGRQPSSDIQVTDPGISKSHLEIRVTGGAIVLQDLKSSNGTFLNGVRIKGGSVKASEDKIGIHNILFEVIPYEEGGYQVKKKKRQLVPARSHSQVPAHAQSMPPAPYQEQAAYSAPEHPHEAEIPPPPVTPQGIVQKWRDQIEEFKEKKLLPAVYHLPTVFEFKQVLMTFVGIYIVLVTLVSIVPMNMITAESIQNESLRRALTVARSLATANEKIIRSNDLSNFSTEMVVREEGVTDLYIVSREGLILAPPERTGSAPREVGFIRKIRGQTREFAEPITDGQMAAAVPILVFDPELQQNKAKAYAVIIYNPGSLAFDDGRAFSLFIQMLFLALVIGSALYFFLSKLIERPFRLLNEELNLALRDSKDQIQVQFNFPVLHQLLTNINSLLARAAEAQQYQHQGTAGAGARDAEIHNLMELIGYPSLLISKDERVLRLSSHFEAFTGFGEDSLKQVRIKDISKPEMAQAFESVIRQASQNFHEVAKSEPIELRETQWNVNCQALLSASGEIEYYLIVLQHVPRAEGSAA